MVVRLPVPEAPPAPAAVAPTPTPAPTATPAPPPPPASTPAPGATATPSPTPAPAPSGPPRTFFLYSVRTVAEGGEASAWSNIAALVLLPAPATATALAVEPRARGIELSWQAAGSGIAGFAIYRRPAASRSYGEPIAALPADARKHLDESASYGERYIYGDALGSQQPRVESAFGEEREVGYEDRFAPAPPVDLVALPQEGGVSLVWQASPDSDAVGYIVYRRDPGGEFRRVTPQPVADLKYTDSGFTGGLAFRYRVTAIDAAGNEGPHDHEAVGAGALSQGRG